MRACQRERALRARLSVRWCSRACVCAAACDALCASASRREETPRAQAVVRLGDCIGAPAPVCTKVRLSVSVYEPVCTQ
eukprot:1141616-Pleurochrysis_carterae.AAC.1